MPRSSILSLFLFTCISYFSFAQKAVQITEVKDTKRISEYLHVFHDTSEKVRFSELADKPFHAFSIDTTSTEEHVQWVKFTLGNDFRESKKLYLSIAFADSIEFYYPDNFGSFVRKDAGDTFPLAQRDVKIGQIIVFEFTTFPGNSTVFAKIVSRGNLSYQARKLTLNSFTLYSETGFAERYMTPRYYQSLFYGAMLIMFFYNFFLFITVKSRSYLFYTFYIIGTIVFFASNSGYMLEFFYPNWPRLDIFVRFLTVPFLMMNFIIFSQSYLSLHRNAPKFNRFFYGLLIVYGLTTLLMVAKFWMLGRTINIGLAVLTFLSVLVAAVYVYRKGFTPARYFLIANFLVLTGGIVFALEKTSLVVHNPLTQYSIQITMVLEMALFSIGLADRINLTRRQLADEKLANERLEKEQVEERKRLIEQKNEELEIKVKERTEEVVAQKEEIEHQNKNIKDSIRYASRIQKAVLGSQEEIVNKFRKIPGSDAFILFFPKDIVSGDFYWYAEAGSVPGNLPAQRVVIAADCTGHGVPGAFMTMLGSSALDEIVNDHSVTEPAKILSELDKKVVAHLTKEEENQTHDGMDMACLVFDTKARTVTFAGAKNPLLIAKNGEVEKVKASIYPIGSLQYGTEKQFKEHTFSIEGEQTFYVFSDGYQDQFGGPKNTKFMAGKFRKLLAEISTLPMPKQKEILLEKITAWKEGYQQTDDILVMGFSV